MTKTIQYNLLIEPWIPVVTLTHEAKMVSLREGLVRAHELRELSSEMPHMNAALLRLLLAVLHRVFGPSNPEEWKRLWDQGQFDADALEKYFSEQPYFDLFDAERPFFQFQHPQVAIKPIQALRQLIGGGDTFTLFDHIMDETYVEMDADEAARLLVTAQSFSLAGLCNPQLKLQYKDAVSSRAISFFAESQNLFETLLLNMIRYNPAEPIPWTTEEPDCPVWEKADPYTPDRNIPFGYLDYLTWPNRKIMLFPIEKDGGIKVTQVTLAPGLSLDAEILNPMYHYHKEPAKKNEENPRRVMRFNSGRALWRDSYSLLQLSNDSIDPPRALPWMKELVDYGFLPQDMVFQYAAYGMCTEPGKQKVNFYRGDKFSLSNQFLKNPALVECLGEALIHAEQLRKELWIVFYTLAERMITSSSDGEESHKPDKKDVQNLIAHWDGEGIFWGQLEVPFFLLLHHLPDHPEEAVRLWNEELRRSAWTAYNQIVVGLGTSKNALKAAATTKGSMAFRINHVLNKQQQEEG